MLPKDSTIIIILAARKFSQCILLIILEQLMMFVKYKITDLLKGKLHFSNYVAYHSFILWFCIILD